MALKESLLVLTVAGTGLLPIHDPGRIDTVCLNEQAEHELSLRTFVNDGSYLEDITAGWSSVDQWGYWESKEENSRWVKHGKTSVYSPKKELIQELWYAADKLHGKELRLSAGRQSMATEYVDGVKHGSEQAWHQSSGSLFSSFEYRRGKKHGYARMYYESGVMEKEAHFDNDMLDGQVTTWHENGKMASRCSYTGGKKNGYEYQWNQSGEETSRTLFKDGDVVDE